MSREKPFALHYQSFWAEQSCDAELPLWQRVGALAFSCHRANGHANFVAKNHELAFLLNKPPDQISRAIARAKEKGWLAMESNSHCLVVPSFHITGGLGKVHERCSVHIGRRTAASRRLRVA